MQKTLFDNQNNEKLLEDVFQAYFDARKNKRNTVNALAFEQHFETELFKLYDEIISGNYQPSRSICFIVDKPVKREIFAANFRDRVVHHLIYNYISSIFDKTFINDSYSCRIGKGTHYGIKRIDKFMRSCSQNYKKDAYVLKLDIKGYFMSINRGILFNKIKQTLYLKLHQIDFDLSLVLDLIQKTIFNDSTKDCIIKGEKSDWEGLPKDKSLFHTKSNCGLPIGNLTSQLFGNIYMNEFDHYVKKVLKIKHYGRYVDDFILIHKSKKYLNSLIKVLSNFLLSTLDLVIHPNKICLQHFSKGVKYLGAVIKPHRIYIANRTMGNFYDTIKQLNKIVIDRKPNGDEKDKFISSMNSYLGILSHYKTYKIRKRMLFENLSGWWWNYAYLSGGYKKFIIK
ncbi:MAG: group II intron reverse transcriptase domain-containing protein [Candidatus Marinimicrobia bacterium]|nr:group II intron reverse transcriptase domain-containing protein [Candidatus Neomarinimicrobiota bacterium]MBL7110207.1 group II intron reverse transcriptase domain-containing protein [Candidatus Neomarinimicrobiota bacterium]